MRQKRQEITAPLLYRLIDLQPDVDSEIDSHKYIDLENLQRDIRENLEKILNTRLAYFIQRQDGEQIPYSILNYGISDFSQQYYSLQKNQQQLCRSIQSAIEHFENRLSNINVTLVNDNDAKRSFVIRIEAMINIEPEAQKTSFESDLDIVRYKFLFNEEG